MIRKDEKIPSLDFMRPYLIGSIAKNDIDSLESWMVVGYVFPVERFSPSHFVGHLPDDYAASDGDRGVSLEIKIGDGVDHEIPSVFNFRNKT